MSTMRNTLNAVRYDWLGVRIGGSGASMQGLWPVLIVAILLVFGCFFAIGRAFSDGATPQEGSSAAPVARVTIPDGLEGGSPIAGEVPSAITAPPPRRKPAQASGAAVLRATSPSGSTTGEATGSSTPNFGSPAESAAAPEPTEPAPSPAPAPAGAGGDSGSSGSASGGSRGGSSGGRSFDSSE